MTDKLSIIRADEITLETTRADKAASFVKAIAVAAPIVGSLVAELLTVTIPNQKQDRIVAFLKVLDDRVKYIEEDLLNERMSEEGFTDLLEDALHQASRTLSKERRGHIASLLKNSLTNDELDHVGQKRLLAILNDLNDAEIIILKYETLRKNEREAFEKEHEKVLTSYLRHYYLERLVEQGLLQRVAVVLDSGVGHEETPLGEMLLRYIE